MPDACFILQEFCQELLTRNLAFSQVPCLSVWYLFYLSGSYVFLCVHNSNTYIVPNVSVTPASAASLRFNIIAIGPGRKREDRGYISV